MLVVEVNASPHLLNGLLRELLSLGTMSALVVFGGFQFGLRGLKVALICHDAYRAYAMLAPVNSARVLARRALAQLTVKSRTGHVVFAAVTEQSGDEGHMRKCDTSSGSSWR